MELSNQQGTKFISINFDWLWRYFPIRRSTKEDIKWFLFTVFPFLFRKWVIFQNWKYAKVFRGSAANPRQRAYWQRKFNNRYSIALPTSDFLTIDPNNQKKLAVVVHVFYPEVFREIVSLLTQPSRGDLWLYLTGPPEVLEEIKPLIPAVFQHVKYFPVKNHGRDILPFLSVLPHIFQDGHELLLKLHTKYSNHLNRREHWRNDLLSKLIGEGMINRAMDIFEKNPLVGIVGPAGNILPMQLYYAANGERVQRLSNQMGIEDMQLSDMNFVAGSMFYATKSALMPIVKLGLNENDFEPEAGQTDGTMAHVVERLFAAALLKAKLCLADTDYDFENPVLTVSKVNHFIV